MREKSETDKKSTSKNKPKAGSKTNPEKIEKPIRRIRKSRDRAFLKLEYRFKNNQEEWFSIMLRDGCDLCEDYRLLQYELEDVFGDQVEYFLPVYVEPAGKKQIGFALFDGYVFVKKTDTIHEGLLTRRTECFDGVLRGTYRQRPINNRDINHFKTKIRHELDNRLPKKSNKVSVYEGTFKNMEGNVLSVNKRNRTACVEFRKKTRIVEAVLSVVNFEIIRG